MAAEKRGLYRIDVPGDGRVRLSVRDGGSARIYSDTSGFALRDGRTAELVVAGDNSGDWEFIANVAPDAMDQWVSDRERYLVQRLRYDTQYYDEYVWGAEDLDAYGDWSYAPEYGWVWRPHTTVINVYQDWAGWLEEGIVDVAMPMNYDDERVASQRAWYDQWTVWQRERKGKRQVVAGVGLFLNEPAGGLAQIRRALEPGGQLVVSECVRPWPDDTLYPELVFNLLQTFRSPRLHPGYRPNGGFLTPEQWTGALEAAGFRDVRLLPDVTRIREAFSGFHLAAIGATRSD